MPIPLAQPLIILIVNDLSFKATKAAFKSGEVETTNTREGKALLCSRIRTRAHTKGKHTLQRREQGTTFNKGVPPSWAWGQGYRELYIYTDYNSVSFHSCTPTLWGMGLSLHVLLGIHRYPCPYRSIPTPYRPCQRGYGSGLQCSSLSPTPTRERKTTANSKAGSIHNGTTIIIGGKHHPPPTRESPHH